MSDCAVDADNTPAQPLSWLEMFPWLGLALDPSDISWWAHAVDEVGSIARDDHLKEITTLVMTNLSHLTIGDLFPRLPSALDVARIGLPPRALNVFNRQGVVTTGDVRPFEVAAIMDWRNVGVTTVEAILYRLADASISSEAQGVEKPLRTADEATAQTYLELAPVTWISDLHEDISSIARWQASVGLSDHAPLSYDPVPAWTPASIVAAYERVRSLRVDEIISRRELRTIAMMLGDELADMGERSIEVLTRRLFADEPETLDALGRRFAVTRERVRQIEAKARAVLDDSLAKDESIASVLVAWVSLTGLIRPIDEVTVLLPALGDIVPWVEVPAWRALERISGEIEVRDGWCAIPDMTAARDVTDRHLNSVVDEYGVVRISSVDVLIFGDGEPRTSTTASWLSYCGYVLDGDFVLTKTNSVGDYAAAILSLQNRPMSAQELVDHFVHERNASSLRNALATDERFDRVDRDLWALRNWGMEQYTSIRSLIREQISKSSGQVRLTDLVDQISGRFSVSASSIAAYASSPPFEQRGGVVRIAERDQEGRKRPHQTRRLFRRPDGWALRVVISKEHHRGSGSLAPKTITGILGLQYGETVDLPSRLGPQAVFWTGIQPGFGTIRRFLIDLQVLEGSEAFLVIHDDRSFSFEPVDRMTGDPACDVLALTSILHEADVSA